MTARDYLDQRMPTGNTPEGIPIGNREPRDVHERVLSAMGHWMRSSNYAPTREEQINQIVFTKKVTYAFAFYGLLGYATGMLLTKRFDPNIYRSPTMALVTATIQRARVFQPPKSTFVRAMIVVGCVYSSTLLWRNKSREMYYKIWANAQTPFAAHLRQKYVVKHRLTTSLRKFDPNSKYLPRDPIIDDYDAKLEMDEQLAKIKQPTGTTANTQHDNHSQIDTYNERDDFALPPRRGTEADDDLTQRRRMRASGMSRRRNTQEEDE